MLAQHPWTGQLYDVPDYPTGLAGGYGFGPLAALLPAIGSAIPAIGNLVGGLLRPPTPPPPAAAMVPPPLPPLPFPSLPGLPSPGALLPPFLNAIAPGILPRPIPPGYTQPPYPGAAPPRRRVYLRCAMWPGPPGLVPTAALSPVTVVPPPGAPMPGPMPLPLVPGGGFSRRSRGRRRR